MSLFFNTAGKKKTNTLKNVYKLSTVPVTSYDTLNTP